MTNTNDEQSISYYLKTLKQTLNKIEQQHDDEFSTWERFCFYQLNGGVAFWLDYLDEAEEEVMGYHFERQPDWKQNTICQLATLIKELNENLIYEPTDFATRLRNIMIKLEGNVK